jgi:anti-sigma B factor antagonist
MAVTPDDPAVTTGDSLVSEPVEPLPLQFHCDIAVVEDRAIVGVRGDIDIATAPELRRRLLAALVLPLRGLVLDLGYVSFMDSSGIGVLVEVHKAALELNTELRLTSVPRQVRRVLEVTGVAESLGIGRAAD